MVLCIHFVIKCYLCWRAHWWITAGLAIIFCVLETEMELVGQNKQHYICINRTTPIVLKTLTTPCVGGSILFQACFSASGRPQLGTTEGRWIPRRIQKCIYLMRMSVRHLQVCKSRVFCHRTGFYACFQNSFCGIFSKSYLSILLTQTIRSH